MPPRRVTLAWRLTTPNGGESPVVWVGSGVDGIDGLTAGDPVTAEQMRALFGCGMYPLAELRQQQLAGPDLTERDYHNAARLGTPFKIVNGDLSPFRLEVARRFAAIQTAAGLPAGAPLPAAEIISTILEAAPPVEVRAKTINDELPNWLTSTENHSLIVTNSWDAYYELIPSEQFTFNNDDLLKTASGTPVLRLYDNRSPFVAAFLTPRAIRCKLSARRDELSTPNGFVIDNTILVSVRELNESDLMAFALDSATSQNDYRAKALIEASEELTVEVADSKYIKVWTLITDHEEKPT
jgi:hypothetical protein